MASSSWFFCARSLFNSLQRQMPSVPVQRPFRDALFEFDIQPLELKFLAVQLGEDSHLGAKTSGTIGTER